MLIAAIRSLLITTVLFHMGQSSVNAEPLRYSWRSEVSHVYELELSADVSGETNSSKGEIHVTAKPYDSIETRSQPLSASAVVISTNGYALTCAHIVHAMRDIKITIADQNYSAERIYIDLESDLALLKIRDAVFQPAELAPLDSVNLGQAITSMGFPLVDTRDSTLTVRLGVVSGIMVRAGKPTIQIDAGLNTGNSGDPVFNEGGQLAAMVTSKFAHPGVQDVGFAVPIKTIREFLDTVRSEKQLEIDLPMTEQSERVTSEELATRGSQCVGFVTGMANKIGDGAATLSYTGHFGDAIRTSSGTGSRGGGRRGGTHFLRSSPNLISGESLVDPFGEIYESKHNRQLPFLLGPILDLAIVRFPENESKSWTNSSRAQVNQSPSTLLGRLSQNDWGSVTRSDDLRLRIGTFDATEIITFEEIERDQRRVVLRRDYSLRTNDSVERPTFSLTGTGKIDFDLALGVVRRHEMRLTLIQESENVTVRLPVSLKLSLVDREVIEQRKRETAAEMAHVQAEKQAVAAAEAAMEPAARVNYYLTQFHKSGTGSAGGAWLLKLRDMEPSADLRELVTETMLAIGLDPASWTRREAMEVLERWATNEDIPKLLKLATASDGWAHYVHGTALRILGKLKAESAIDLMLLRLKDPRTRRDASEALKLMGSASEVKVLALLPEEDDIFARSTILDVLSTIGTEKSIDRLTEYKNKVDRTADKHAIDRVVGAIESRLAADAIVRQLPGGESEPTSPVARDPLTNRSVPPTSFDALRGAIQELRVANTIAAKIAAISKLESLAVNTRYQEAVEKELLRYIQPQESALWPIIASALTKWGTSASLEKLQEMLKADGDNEALTILIIANLQHLDSPEATLLLLPLLSSDNPVIREQTIFALSSVGKHVESKLIELLKADDEQLQYDVVAILRSLGSASSRDAIAELMRNSTSDRVREAARKALPDLSRSGK